MKNQIPTVSPEEIETILGGPRDAGPNDGEETESAYYAAPVMDEDDVTNDGYARGYRDASLRAVDHWKSVFAALLIFKGDAAFALRCAIAAHGFWDLLPQRDQIEIAAQFGFKQERKTDGRANVNKLIKAIQKRLGLQPTLGQRSVDECQNMSKTRKSQLKPV